MCRGGFAWGAEDPGKAFNWHPLLMVIGLIFLYGNGKFRYILGLLLHGMGNMVFLIFLHCN
jgi:hypothetical protein